MEWQQLEYFITVAQLQHFTRAAKQLSISQPALSRSIAKLEDELGVPLFERHGKSISLNQFGQLFYQHADQAMQEIKEAKQEIQDIINPDHGTIALSFLHSLGTHMVPELLGKFRVQYPKIQFKLYQNATNFLFTQLESSEIDLCLSSPPKLNQTNIEWTPLFTEELFVVVPADHRLANRLNITLKEIADEPIITFKPDYGLRTLTDQLFSEAGLTPKITFEGDEILTVAGLVEAKLGVAVIPHLMSLTSTNLSFLPISEPVCYRTIGLAWMKGRYTSPVVKKFRDFVLDSFQASPK